MINWRNLLGWCIITDMSSVIQWQWTRYMFTNNTQSDPLSVIIVRVRFHGKSNIAVDALQSRHPIYEPLQKEIFSRLGPSYQHVLTWIRIWISKNIPSEVWDEITWPLRYINCCTAKDCRDNFSIYFITDLITYPCWYLNWSMLVKRAPEDIPCGAS